MNNRIKFDLIIAAVPPAVPENQMSSFIFTFSLHLQLILNILAAAYRRQSDGLLNGLPLHRFIFCTVKCKMLLLVTAARFT